MSSRHVMLARAQELVARPAPANTGPLARRLEAHWQDLTDALDGPYGGLGADRLHAFEERLVALMTRAWERRQPALRALDDEREARPDWFQEPSMIGYATYVDRFAGSLRGVAEHVDYLAELGVRYLHLMPLLRTRPGENDGGYAVTDYRAVEPRLGTTDDLASLAAVLRSRGVSLCTDLVLNHVAVEHEWAIRARHNDPVAVAMFHIFADRTEPDRYEASLPEVFPTLAPGNFSRLDDGRWVWTTFHAYQWDLNWANPDVFAEMLDLLLMLANLGVEVIRLDAVAFMWKRRGTNCQNQPEVHHLLRALRTCTRIVAPAVIHKAEAIVGPDDLIPYLGSADERESDLAYHNSLMVQYWAALASQHTGLMVETLRQLPTHPPTAAWATYLRCHDDIGWAVTDGLAAAVGIEDAGAHRRWLADFYAGAVPVSFARGAYFQDNPTIGDRRTSGTMASLAGLEAAVEAGDDGAVELAIRRIALGHALIYGFDGIPIIWMGDEIGLRNDTSYAADPAKAGDSRWLHRPQMEWGVAADRNVPGSIAARIFGALKDLGRIRAGLPQLHASVPLAVLDTGNPRLFAFVRMDARHGPLVAVHNFSDAMTFMDRSQPAAFGLMPALDRITSEMVAPEGDHLEIGPYQALWLTRPSP